MDLLKVSQHQLSDLAAFIECNQCLPKDKIKILLNHCTADLEYNHRKILEYGNNADISRKKISLISTSYHMQIADEEFKDEEIVEQTADADEPLVKEFDEVDIGNDLTQGLSGDLSQAGKKSRSKKTKVDAIDKETVVDNVTETKPKRGTKKVNEVAKTIEVYNNRVEENTNAVEETKMVEETKIVEESKIIEEVTKVEETPKKKPASRSKKTIVEEKLPTKIEEAPTKIEEAPTKIEEALPTKIEEAPTKVEEVVKPKSRAKAVKKTNTEEVAVPKIEEVVAPKIEEVVAPKIEETQKKKPASRAKKTNDDAIKVNESNTTENVKVEEPIKDNEIAKTEVAPKKSRSKK